MKSDHSMSTNRPPRKTKEAATVYLNMLGQKILKNANESNNDVEDDAISVESFSEATQEKRLKKVKKESSGRVATSNVVSKKKFEEDGKNKKTLQNSFDAGSGKKNKNKNSLKVKI